MNNSNKGKIAHVIQAISIIPLLIFGIVIMILSSSQFTKTMQHEIEDELRFVNSNVETMLNLAYPGDYQLVGEDSLALYKGEHNITYDCTLFDGIKQKTNLDITLFYQDTRILTTIHTSDGIRIIGSGAPDIVVHEVLEKGESHFYTKALINGKKYFSYYSPLENSDGTIIGMLFVGKPSDSVHNAIYQAIIPLAIADIGVMLVIAICIFLYTRNFATSLLKIHAFISDVSSGNLNATLDSSVLSRYDEFGDIGRSALSMQRALRHMVEQDTLTELSNRRCANRKLEQIFDKSTKQNIPFSLAIGDIDYFKHVNDTYGHECGDVVLKKVADTLRDHMLNCGFAARWGGEEFLLVFDHMDVQEAYTRLTSLQESIRDLKIAYNDEIISITMTFGLAAGDNTDLHKLLSAADDKLYQGKESGRNRIVL